MHVGSMTAAYLIRWTLWPCPPLPTPSLGTSAIVHKSEHEYEQSKVNLRFVCCQSGPNKACQKLQTACLHVNAAGTATAMKAVHCFPAAGTVKRDFFPPKHPVRAAPGYYKRFRCVDSTVIILVAC